VNTSRIFVTYKNKDIIAANELVQNERAGLAVPHSFRLLDMSRESGAK
jgi:hypothetical protein